MKHVRSRSPWPIVLLCCAIIGLALPARAQGVAASATPSASPPPPTAGTPAPTTQPGPGSFTMTQTLSDNAQGMTIAFDGLAFLTGTLGADSFFPPGKVADFWGFQYLRDNDPSEMGHNTDFLTNASLNMLTVLSADQKAQLITLAKSQVDSINQYGYKRFVLMTAFRRLLTGDLPTGTTGLNTDAVKAFSTELYHLDGEISFARAQVMGNILANLDTTQHAYLDAMVGKGMTSWPTVTEPLELRPLSQDEKVAVMTYAGDLFSWYAGSIDADVYFCPERQGTYFGSFYMKDAPAVGNPGYSIGTNITADLGNAFLAALTPAQAALVTDLVTSQKPALYEIVDRRKDVSTLLRQFIAGQTPDSATVLSLMDRYGALDGDIIARYATAFAQVGQSLSADQQAQLVKLRTDLLSTLAYPTGAYLYAQAIALPSVINTDFLFAATSVPTTTSTPLPTVSGTPLPPVTGTPLPTVSGTPLPPVTGTPPPTRTGTPPPTVSGTPPPTVSGTPPPTRTGTPPPPVTGTPPPPVTGTPLPTATGTPQGQTRQIKGKVEARSTAGTLFGNWIIAGLTISVTETTAFLGFGADGPQVGACVEVAYNEPSATTRIARKISPDSECPTTDIPTRLEMKGKIETRSENGVNGTWTIGGLSFEIGDATFFDGFNGIRPTVNACVNVTYVVKNGKNAALRIRPDDTCGGSSSDRSFRGSVDARPRGNNIGDWVIGGQSFVVTDTTAFDTSFSTPPAVGDCVGLTYSVVGTTRIVATIFQATCAQDPRVGVFEAHGRVDKVPSGSDTTWTISGVAYAVNASTSQTEDYGKIDVGACVQVHYTKDIYYSDARILVSIETESNYRCTPSAENHEFYGHITHLPGTTGELGSWTVGNLVLAVTADTTLDATLTGGSFTVGQLVSGKFQRAGDGSLIAVTITAKRTASDENDHRGIGKAIGLIDTRPVSDTIGTWMISSTSYTVTANTRLEGSASSMSFAVGDCVEVYFQADTTGVRTAKKISKVGDATTCATNLRAYGTVTASPATGYQGTWTVGGVNYQTDTNTVFVEDHGTLGVGAFVTVKYDPATMVIVKISTVVPPGTGDKDNSGRLTMSGPAPRFLTATTSPTVTWTINGQDYQVIADTLLDDTVGVIQDGATVQVNAYIDTTTGQLIATQVTAMAPAAVTFSVYLPMIVR